MQCPSCNQENTHFFNAEEDYGYYELYECLDCEWVFSPQRDFEKRRKRLNWGAVGVLACIGISVLVAIFPAVVGLVFVIGLFLVPLAAVFLDEFISPLNN